ncbi:MAG TPA: hypothetical protein VLA66_11525 [Thermoanaerobaculia bacterium]|nr:hypothetical protein [Thermoanaerobaculia bacterium]
MPETRGEEAHREGIWRRAGRVTSAVAIALLAGCFSYQPRVFDPIRSSLESAGVVRVEAPRGNSSEYLAKRFNEAFQECTRQVHFRASGEADIVLRWHDDAGPVMCLDEWQPSCDPRTVIVDLADDRFEVRWGRSRPRQCALEDCLFWLFARDLRAVMCPE